MNRFNKILNINMMYHCIKFKKNLKFEYVPIKFQKFRFNREN